MGRSRFIWFTEIAQAGMVNRTRASARFRTARFRICKHSNAVVSLFTLHSLIDLISLIFVDI